MASKRKPIHTTTNPSNSNHLNFRSASCETTRNDSRGTRPTTAPATVKEVILMMIMHVCKKILFFDINLKVALYLGCLFLISLIGDFIPYPKSYFARSDNLFNVYFVKMGWAWTLLLSSPFLFMTSYTLCCGDAQRFLKHHLPRIAIATFFWFSWTKLFNIIENAYGRCNVRNFDSKSSCLKAGHFWNGFDISGHAFILIYSSLVLIEEARPIIGWEYIKEHIRNEQHSRSVGESSGTNPLRFLKDTDIVKLKHLYEKYTPAIRTIFIGVAVLQLLWDVMLVCTILYYHNMIEKVLSGIFAILTWFFCYRFWYPSTSFLPDAAGQGVFNYQKLKHPSIPLKRSPSLLSQRGDRGGAAAGDIPKFMGMPLYALNPQQRAADSSSTANPNTAFNSFYENTRFQDPNSMK